METLLISPSPEAPHWEKITITSTPILMEMDLGNVTFFYVTIFKDSIFYDSFGQVTKRGLFVGIERKGCFYFSDSNNFYHPKYVSEKLNILIPDALYIADWMNVQLDRKAPIYGTYGAEREKRTA